MIKNSSFDIVSDFDFQELNNAINQTKKEIYNRYDFKDSESKIFLDSENINIETSNSNKLNSIIDILKSKMIKRKLFLKILDFKKIEFSSKGLIKQIIKLKKGLDQEISKKIIKIIKDSKLKIQSQIQGETIRVTSKNINDLQKIIFLIKKNEFERPIQFINYR